jgi:hypothetical protein
VLASLRISWRRVASASGSSTRLASTIRQAAIASEAMPSCWA